jgi:gliding motility-associated-like protein
MKSTVCLSIVLSLCSSIAVAQVASFTAPDTVCVNSPVTLTNTSTGGSSWYWSFCANDPAASPTAENLGNPGNLLSAPTFVTTVYDGKNYYAFVTDNSRRLVRYTLEKNFLGTPSSPYNFGSLGDKLPQATEGIQALKDVDGWHLLIVGGSQTLGPSITRIDFGATMDNNNPTAVNWGNIGNMAYPTDMSLFQEGGQWYGFTANADNNSISRFTFGANVKSSPQAANFDGDGLVNFPTGLYTISVNGNWYVFVTNTNDNTISRFDFGASLQNVPKVVNLGNPDGMLSQPRDLYLVADCNGISGVLLNGGNNSVVHLSFDNGNVDGAIHATTYGNIGKFNYPSCLSSFFRDGTDLYSYVANSGNGTISRLKFSSCSNSTILASNLKTPPSFSYSKPGTYNIMLSMDEGLPTQQTFCHTIVVLQPAAVHLGNDTTTCFGQSVLLNAGNQPNVRYQWSDGSMGQWFLATASGQYVLRANNGGCIAKDTIRITIDPPLSMNALAFDIDCRNKMGAIQTDVKGGTTPFAYSLNDGGLSQTGTFSNLSTGKYKVEVTDYYGCLVSQTVTITKTVDTAAISFSSTITEPSCYGYTDGQLRMNVAQTGAPVMYSMNNKPYQTSNIFPMLGAGAYTIQVKDTAGCKGSLVANIYNPDPLQFSVNIEDASCGLDNGELTLIGSGGTPPYYWMVNGDSVGSNVASGLKAATYALGVEDMHGCKNSGRAILDNVDYAPIQLLTHDTTVNAGQKVQLNASNAPDYVWSPNIGLSCDTCPSPVALALAPITYTVRTMTGRNCVSEDSVVIHLTFEKSIDIPNAFTPNNDGRNDVFRIRAIGIASFHLFIYNRWGNLMFSTKDPDQGWDGYYKGIFEPFGDYIYMLQYSFVGDEKNIQHKTGIVTLIR